MKIEISVPTMLTHCFKAGVESTELGDALTDTHIRMEYHGADMIRSGLQQIVSHSSSLSSVLTGEARKAAQDLSKYAKELRNSIKGHGAIPKKKMESLEDKIFAMKNVAHFLDVSAKAQCGDPVSKGSLVKFRAPKLRK